MSRSSTREVPSSCSTYSLPLTVHSSPVTIYLFHVTGPGTHASGSFNFAQGRLFNTSMMGLLNISHILPFQQYMSDRTPHGEKYESVQKGSSSKAAAAWASGAYGGVCEHGQVARTHRKKEFRRVQHLFSLPLDPGLIGG